MLVPSFREVMYPHHLRHAKWLDILLCGTPIILMSSDTVRSFSKRVSTMRSLVGSPSPLKNFIRISSDWASATDFRLGLAKGISPFCFGILKYNDIKMSRGL